MLRPLPSLSFEEWASFRAWARDEKPFGLTHAAWWRFVKLVLRVFS